jgi:hypothetical protein
LLAYVIPITGRSPIRPPFARSSVRLRRGRQRQPRQVRRRQDVQRAGEPVPLPDDDDDDDHRGEERESETTLPARSG